MITEVQMLIWKKTEMILHGGFLVTPSHLAQTLPDVSPIAPLTLVVTFSFHKNYIQLFLQ